jgi:endonuclease YncB( thermonuclease family)
MVRALLAISFNLVVLTLFFCPCQAKEKEVLVTKVLDGDTIVLENGDIVRYLGIDAPEAGKKAGGPEFYAREATRYNKQLVLMKRVRLEFDVEKKDSYGRLLAYVHVKNIFVNGELVRLGYARAMIKPPNLSYRDLLLNYQKDAMSKDAGLWQEKKQETEPYYLGNKRTYSFHKPSCPQSSKVSEKNKIIFRSRIDPIKIGYTPCKKCKP